ncbi:hypothetical protein ACWGJ2_36670 [Streptomyces sp. NPDC054796]
MAFLTAAVVLSMVAHMAIADVVLLLLAAGGVGAAVVAATTLQRGGHGAGRLLKRLLKAAVTSGNGS